MKVIIIEDEVRSQQVLHNLLRQYCENVEVVGIAADVPEGVKLINRHQPDLVFLDVEMPGYTGFQLLDFFDHIDFDIIFTTAYQDYALRAFQVSAVDYLLKPIQIPQLIKAVEKVEKLNISKQHNRAHLEVLKGNQQQTHFQKIALSIAESILFVNADDIIYLVAEGAYTNVYLTTSNKKMTISKNLTYFEKTLTHPQFFRAHRSAIINTNHVKEFIRKDSCLVFNNGHQLVIPKDKKEDLLLRLGMNK